MISLLHDSLLKYNVLLKFNPMTDFLISSKIKLRCQTLRWASISRKLWYDDSTLPSSLALIKDISSL